MSGRGSARAGSRPRGQARHVGANTHRSARTAPFARIPTPHQIDGGTRNRWRETASSRRFIVALSSAFHAAGPPIRPQVARICCCIGNARNNGSSAPEDRPQRRPRDISERSDQSIQQLAYVRPLLSGADRGLRPLGDVQQLHDTPLRCGNRRLLDLQLSNGAEHRIYHRDGGPAAMDRISNLVLRPSSEAGGAAGRRAWAHQAG